MRPVVYPINEVDASLIFIVKSFLEEVSLGTHQTIKSYLGSQKSYLTDLRDTYYLLHEGRAKGGDQFRVEVDGDYDTPTGVSVDHWMKSRVNRGKADAVKVFLFELQRQGWCPLLALGCPATVLVVSCDFREPRLDGQPLC